MLSFPFKHGVKSSTSLILPSIVLRHAIQTQQNILRQAFGCCELDKDVWFTVLLKGFSRLLFPPS